NLAHFFIRHQCILQSNKYNRSTLNIVSFSFFNVNLKNQLFFKCCHFIECYGLPDEESSYILFSSSGPPFYWIVSFSSASSSLFSGSSREGSFFRYLCIPVPAGTSLPMITFSLSPISSSF